MKIYDIVWDSVGNTIARNMVVTDPRPTSVTADDYELLTGPDGGIGGVKFYRGEDPDEPFLVVFDVPLMITIRES